MPENEVEVIQEPVADQAELSDDRRVVLFSQAVVEAEASQGDTAPESAQVEPEAPQRDTIQESAQVEPEDPQIASYLFALSLYGNQMLLEIMGQRLSVNMGKNPSSSYQHTLGTVQAVVSFYDEKLSFPSGYSQMVAKYGAVIQACSNYISETQQNGVNGEEETKRLNQVDRTLKIAQQEIEILRKRYKPPEAGQEPPSLRKLFMDEGHKELLKVIPEAGETRESESPAPADGVPAEGESSNPFLQSDGTLDSREKTLTDRIAALEEKELCAPTLPKLLRWLNHYHTVWAGKPDVSVERDKLENGIILVAQKVQNSKALKELVTAIRASASKRNLAAMDLPTAGEFRESVGTGVPEEKLSALCGYLEKYHAESETNVTARKELVESILAALEGSGNNAAAERLGKICRQKVDSQQVATD